MDNAVVHVSDVPSKPSNHHCAGIYTMREEDLETKTRPLIHPVRLKGKKGILSTVNGIFNDGAMINSICNKVFPGLQKTLRSLNPSMKTL
jgi:hypothetical protein